MEFGSMSSIFSPRATAEWRYHCRWTSLDAFFVQKPKEAVAASIMQLLTLSLSIQWRVSQSLWARRSGSRWLCSLGYTFSQSRSTLDGSLQALTLSHFFGCCSWMGGRMLGWMYAQTRQWSVQHSAPCMARVRCTSWRSERHTMT